MSESLSHATLALKTFAGDDDLVYGNVIAADFEEMTQCLCRMPGLNYLCAPKILPPPIIQQLYF